MVLIITESQAVLQCGVQQENLVLVSLWSHAKALGRFLKTFAKLRLVTAKILRQDDPSAEELSTMLHSRLLFQEQQQQHSEPNNNKNFQRR